MKTSKILWHGGWHQPTGFARVNRALVTGLRQNGWNVAMLPDDGAFLEDVPVDPELYVFHGHPWRLEAPGRRNLFLLAYEYPELKSCDRWIISELDNRFDRVATPTSFVTRALRKAGLQAPIDSAPWGFDPKVFCPPRHVPEGPFTFLYVGVVSPRKGVDLLLEAFAKELSGQPARLVIKEGLRTKVGERFALDMRRKADQLGVEWIESTADEIDQHYLRADCGVFPTRGEGFGLTVLECLACGTPVIVTSGSGCDAFCRPEAALAIPTNDLHALRAALRFAFESGRPDLERRRQVAHSVSDWTWEASLRAVEMVMERSLQSPGLADLNSSTGSTRMHVFLEPGRTSWKKVASEVARALPRARSAPRGTLWDLSGVKVAVGQAGHSQELFRRLPNAARLLYCGSTPEASLAAENSERLACGAEPLATPQLALQRARAEWDLAQSILAPSRFVLERAEQYGYPVEKGQVLPHGFGPLRARPYHPPRRPLVLFAATLPFRKGVRLLFEAWSRLRPRAQLLCLVGGQVLSSPALLRILLRHPEITVRSLMSPRALSALYPKISFQVHPSLEDGFGMMVSEAMASGIPAIVSTSSGVSELLTDRVDGRVIEPRIELLVEALDDMLSGEWLSLREAAWERARQRSWKVYRKELREILCDF